MDITKLIQIAKKYKERSYSPYSSFKVGACVYTDNHQYYGGCNIENASYGATICAEQVAVTKAISESNSKILAIAIVGDQPELFPCGICRQILREFSENSLKIYIMTTIEDANYKVYSLKDLLPNSFGPESLGEKNV